MKSEITEAIHRAEVTKLFLEKGWMVYTPEADIDGVDFLIMNLQTAEVRKIQLKSRWSVDKKYGGKDIWMCFPDKERNWYLCEHDKMIKYGLDLGWKLQQRKDGAARPNYSTSGMSKSMMAMMSKHRLSNILQAAS